VAGAQYAKNENPVDYHHIHGKATEKYNYYEKNLRLGFPARSA